MADDSRNGIADEILKKLSWTLILVPGFIVLMIIAWVASLPMTSEFFVTISSAAISVAILVTCMLALRAFGMNPATRAFGISLVSLSLIASVVLGFLIGVAVDKDLPLKGLRALGMEGVLSKYSGSRPLETLIKQNVAGTLAEESDNRAFGLHQDVYYVAAKTKDGEVFEGLLRFYGLGTPTELYLSPACKRTEDGKGEPLRGAGIVIFERELIWVSFIDPQAGQCAGAWQNTGG